MGLGVDIVAQQFRIASGESIADLQIGENGYAIEARINAERVHLAIRRAAVQIPTPGEIRECEFPDEPGVEVIAAAAPGKFVSPYYDSMVAQIIVHAADRPSAIAKLRDYLAG
jgi:acetyl/propionyl-CoA carboxylase alpha subunit